MWNLLSLHIIQIHSKYQTRERAGDVTRKNGSIEDLNFTALSSVNINHPIV